MPVGENLQPLFASVAPLQNGRRECVADPLYDDARPAASPTTVGEARDVWDGRLK